MIHFKPGKRGSAAFMQSSFCRDRRSHQTGFKSPWLLGGSDAKEYCSESLAKELIKVLTPSDHVPFGTFQRRQCKFEQRIGKTRYFYKDLALYHVKGKPLADGMLLSQCSHLVFGSASGVKAF